MKVVPSIFVGIVFLLLQLSYIEIFDFVFAVPAVSSVKMKESPICLAVLRFFDYQHTIVKSHVGFL